jgi:peptidoglycan/LPS O-acetylase OafA/YrhL
VKTFAVFSGSRDNNFNILRFIAALLVIISHSFPLSLDKNIKDPLEKWLGDGISLSSVGAFIFLLRAAISSQ